jgi:hypothetical protein
MGWDGLLERMADTRDCCNTLTVKCVCLTYLHSYAYVIQVYNETGSICTEISEVLVKEPLKSELSFRSRLCQVEEKSETTAAASSGT